jgi:hypothetical protein
MEQTLTTFSFHLDTKVTSWYRTEFEIEANSLEEAKLKAIEFHNESNTSSIAWDEVMDTQETMTPDENGGQPTEEIFDEDGNCFWDNTKSN